MAINKNKYDGVHYQVTLMNMGDGSVQGHAAGCADLKRGKAKYAEPTQADEVWDVVTKADAWLTYNADFLAEGGEDNAYEIEWLPCAKHIDEGDTHEAYVAEFGDVPQEAFNTQAEELPAEAPSVTVKVGRIWTYVYAADGSLLAEVRTEASAAVVAALQA